WSLKMIQWRGGYAKGEYVETFIRYLLDELHTYENDHGDALHPIQCNAKHQSLSMEIMYLHHQSPQQNYRSPTMVYPGKWTTL
ncbi:hypothetical protein WOLCODRAFT_84702, partial [Wolfiporia cocos MD-104 SS10]